MVREESQSGEVRCAVRCPVWSEHLSGLHGAYMHPHTHASHALSQLSMLHSSLIEDHVRAARDPDQVLHRCPESTRTCGVACAVC